MWRMFRFEAERHTFLVSNLPNEQGVTTMTTTAIPRTDLELATAARSGDSRMREALILRHAPLVRSIARRYANKGMAFDDIVQSGYLGLIQAVDRYEPSRAVPLRAYAARTIEGEIMHLFRDRGWAVRMPRSLQEMSRRTARTRTELAHTLGRTPTIAELALEMGETEEVVAEATEAHRAYSAEPLAGVSSEETDGASERRADSILAIDDPGFGLVDDRDTLARGLCLLPERERTILALRYLEDLTQSEIAAQLGISQMHVSRLLRRGLDTLQQAIMPGAA